MFSVAKKTALITGGGQGIGKAIAEALISQGANVILSGRKEQTLQKTVEEFRSSYSNKGGGKAEYVIFDVTSPDSIKSAVQDIEKLGLGLDILVNNAGINLRGPLEEMEEDIWQTVIETNLSGVFRVSKAMLPLLKKSACARIVNISSLMAEVSRPTIAAYCAAKGGVRQLTKAMANEWATYSIQVNAIAPGYIATEMNIPLMKDEAFNSYLMQRIPQKRWGAPKDIGACAVFLSSPAADYITGQTIPVDGGFLINM